MGRPKLLLDKVRNTNMIIRFTLDEKARIQALAKKEKITVTQLVKMSIKLYSQTYKKQIFFDFPDFI